jgi:hypothetical protein
MSLAGLASTSPSWAFRSGPNLGIEGGSVCLPDSFRTRAHRLRRPRHQTNS